MPLRYLDCAARFLPMGISSRAALFGWRFVLLMGSSPGEFHPLLKPSLRASNLRLFPSPSIWFCLDFVLPMIRQVWGGIVPPVVMTSLWRTNKYHSSISPRKAFMLQLVMGFWRGGVSDALSGLRTGRISGFTPFVNTSMTWPEMAGYL